MGFSSGLITGPFYAKVDRQYEVGGSFDEHGFFDGEWVWRYPDSTITITWKNGLALKTEITDPDGNILHLEDYHHSAGMAEKYQQLTARQNEKVKDSPFSLDTVSLIFNAGHQLAGLLHATVFEPRYGLYKQIEGDKGFFYNKQTYKMQLNTRGMYVIRMKNKISGTQVQLYARMETLIGRMEVQLSYIYQMRRDGKLNKQAGEAIRLMEHNMTLARRYACMAETMKLYFSHEEGLEAANTSCVWLSAVPDKMPAFSSKEQALGHLSDKIAGLEKENQGHYTNIRKNMVQ